MNDSPRKDPIPLPLDIGAGRELRPQSSEVVLPDAGGQHAAGEVRERAGRPQFSKAYVENTRDKRSIKGKPVRQVQIIQSVDFYPEGA